MLWKVPSIMITGISLHSNPTDRQKRLFSQWMGCARFIWNAKCDEEKYLSSFAKKYLPIGTYPKLDQSFAQYKNRELSPWLFDCPSQILRNSTANWYATYRTFLKGGCGKPKKKRKGDVESIHLTKELFRFEVCPDGVRRLRIGTKTRDLGYLSLKNHRHFKEPKSLYIKKKHDRYWVSFCYEDEPIETFTQEQHLEHFRTYSQEALDQCVMAIDRGVVRPVQAGEKVYDFSQEQKAKKKAKERHIRRCQRRLAKQKKGSRRRNRTKRRLSRAHEKISNIRKDFSHKTSRSIVDEPSTKIIVLEDLKTSKMTRKKKGGSAKSGLNRSILDKGWHQIEVFLTYKAQRAGKALFKVPAHYTSQECADCGHTHPNNRKSQSLFNCERCGHSDNADRNATGVIKKRAINFILDSGTELSKRGVLLGSGRGATNQPPQALACGARSNEASKKKSKPLAA